MNKVKVRDANILLLAVVLLMTVVPVFIIVILYSVYNIDLSEVTKTGDTAKSILLFINQYALILLPVIIFALVSRLNIKEVFRLNPVNIPTVLTTVIMAGGIWVVGQFLSVIVVHIYTIIFGPPSNDIVNVIPQNVFLGFFLIALSPAICEEVLFRGVTLRAYENRGTTKAIFISAILFAAIHQSIVNFVGPLLVGILAAYLVVRSNSIIPGIITHFFFNGFSMFFYYIKDSLPESPREFPTFTEYLALSIFVVLAIGLLAVCLVAFNYFNAPKQEARFNNPVSNILYRIIFWGSPKERVRFNKPVSSVHHDFIFIGSHWPVVIIILIFIALNVFEILSTGPR